MTTEKLNTALYTKMFEEQENFRTMLLTLPPDEVLSRAYEYVIREDILISLEMQDLSSKQAAALLKEPRPIEAIFKKWDNRETEHMDEIWSAINDCADAAIKNNNRARNAQTER